MTPPMETFAAGFGLPECPRWHDGQLWISDMWGRASHRFEIDGSRGRIAQTITVGDEQGGLGWLPDGRMLIVGMIDAKLWRIDPGGPVIHADLRPFTPWGLNDMAVAADGTAYISHFGYDYHGGNGKFAPASLFRVSPEGVVDEAADNLLVPNGVAISESGEIFVAEPAGSRIARLRFAPDGTLLERGIFATLVSDPPGTVAPPDGICLDAAGGIWAADPIGKRVLHFAASGSVTEAWPLDGHPVAVVLGGPDRRDLYICITASIHRDAGTEQRSGRLLVTRVATPGAGVP